MAAKGLFDAISFSQVGGGVTIVGGLIGLYLGGQVFESCWDACSSVSCWNSCPDAYMFAVAGMIPGILIAIGSWIIKKFQTPGQ